MLRNSLFIAAGVLSLAACGEEECTQERAEAKLSEMMAKIQEVGASDPQKLLEFSNKANDIQGMINTMSSASAPEEVCKALDELMETLE